MAEPLITSYPKGVFTDYQRRWQQEYVSSIEREKPKFVVIENSYDGVHHISFSEVVRQIPGLSGVLDGNYHLDTTIYHCQLYHIAEAR